jgi:methylmalonyl-CoA mutase
MDFKDQYFAGFPEVGKEEWLDKIRKDLKGKPIEELYKASPSGLPAIPFSHPDDAPPVLPLIAGTQSWQLCEQLATASAASANAQALEALQFGAEGLEWILPDAWNPEGLPLLLEGIYLDYIGLHFAGKAAEASPALILKPLAEWITKKGVDRTNVSGSIAFDPTGSGQQVDWRFCRELMDFTREALPGFILFTLKENRAAFDSPEGSLADLMARANLYLEKLGPEAAPYIQFELHIGTDYFGEIARIRALRLLWLNVLQAWGQALLPARIVVHFQADAYTDDLFSNMIRATTMAMAAVLGGADRLTVLPYDSGRESSAPYPANFARRIARNVQHLLKMEGMLDELRDPAAGSYFIEQSTGQLAAAAWKKFQGK